MGHESDRYAAPMLHILGIRSKDMGNRLAVITNEVFLKNEWGYARKIVGNFSKLELDGQTLENPIPDGSCGRWTIGSCMTIIPPRSASCPRRWAIAKAARLT